MDLDCSSLKKSLVSYLRREIAIDEDRGLCAITFPMLTLDERLTTIYIERRMSDFYIVHDGGKTAAELFSLGIHLTEAKAESFNRMATRLGGSFGEKLFQVGCKVDKIESAILAVAQCQLLAMTEVLQIKPVIEDETVSSRVERTLEEWKPKYVHKISKNVAVKGKLEPHKFDFVTFASRPHNNVAIKILTPTYTAKGQADRYGFQVLDLSAPASRWPRLALITKADLWPENAIRLVENLSEETLSVKSDEEESIETRLPKTMTRLAKAS